MKITIEYESFDELVHASARFAGLTAEAKPAKAKKPTETVKGNPDAVTETPPAALVVTPAQQAIAEPVKAPTLKADAPAEIVALVTKPGDRDTVGKALLKACKPVAEGGLSREVALSLTEKFRPAGNTEKLVKVGMIPNEQLAALAALVVAEYAK